MEIVKIGNVELTEEQAARFYEEHRYIVTYSKIYKLHYSAAAKQVYGSQIYYNKGMAKRGRFHAMTAETVNHLLGFQLVNEN
jgi:hypothetical protein